MLKNTAQAISPADDIVAETAIVEREVVILTIFNAGGWNRATKPTERIWALDSWSILAVTVKFPLQEEIVRELSNDEQGLIQFTQRDGGIFISFEHEYTVQLFPEQDLVIFPCPSNTGGDVIVLMRNLTTELSSHSYFTRENFLLE